MANAQLLDSYTRHTDLSGEALPIRKATPMLLLGVLHKIELAKNSTNPATRGFHIGRATAIIDALRDNLDIENKGESARNYDEFYSLIDQCLQNSIDGDPQKWLAMAEDSVSRATDFWVLSDEAHYGLSGNA